MADPARDPAALLSRSLTSGRVHSAYLLSGPGEAPRAAARAFARGLACSGSPPRPCEACPACHRSSGGEPIDLDGTGKRGPMYRHIGEHPDLLWVERGPGDTRVRIGQIRALQRTLRLRPNEEGGRAAVIADAEWLNLEAQNALLRLLEEPPPRTCLILVAASASGLVATIRSRCQRVRFPAEERLPLRVRYAQSEQSSEVNELVSRLDAIAGLGVAELLSWAEDYRGPRADAAERVQGLLATGSEWLRERAGSAVADGRHNVDPELDAFKALSECRRDLAQRNANPQMVAERALLAVHQAVAR